MKDLRKTSDTLEIQKILKKLIGKESSIILWQNIDGQRFILQCQSLSLNSKTMEINFEFDQPVLNINHQLNLYISGKTENILFKASISNNNDKVVTVSYPQEVMLREHRSQGRTYIDFPGHTLKVIFTTSHLTNIERHGHLVDFSCSGIALIISKKSAGFLKTRDQIFLHKIGNLGLLIPVKSSIKNYRLDIKDIKNQKVEFIRIGLKFDYPINSSQLKAIVKN